MSTDEGGQLPNSPSLLAETWPNPRGSWCSRDGSDHDSRVGLVENILALILQKGYVIGGDAGVRLGNEKVLYALQMVGPANVVHLTSSTFQQLQFIQEGSFTPLVIPQASSPRHNQNFYMLLVCLVIPQVSSPWQNPENIHKTCLFSETKISLAKPRKCTHGMFVF